MRRTVLGLLASLVVALLVPVLSALPAQAAVTHRILITGDSITQGSSGDYTWRYRLWSKLAEIAPGEVSFVGARTSLYDVVNNSYGSPHYAADFPAKAHGALWGDTFVNELDKIAGQVTATEANVLVVMLGSNDLAYHTSPAATIANLRTYIERARAARPGIDVVVGEVLNKYDPWAKEYQLTTQVNQYASYLQSLASQMNTAGERVVIAPTRTGWDPAVHAWDGTHPNATGEAYIAQRVSQGLAQIGIGAVSPNIAGTKPWSVPGPGVVLAPGSEEADLAWNRTSTGATGMYVEQRLTNTSEAWRRLPYAVTGDGWTAGLLVAGGTYQYRIVPVKGTSVGVAGPASSVTVSGPPLGTIGSLSATEGGASLYGGTTATATWSAATNASGYLIGSVLMSNGDVVWDNLPYPVTKRSWTFEPLQGGRPYRFKAQPIRGYLTGSARVSAAVRMDGLPSGRTYAALGDSYSSGLGSEEDYYHQDCLRSVGAWAFEMQSHWQHSTRHLACAGDKIAGVREQIPAMNSYFAARAGRPQLITLTVGGNDVGFTDTLKKCVMSECAGMEGTISDRITALKPSLVDLYRDLRTMHEYADILVGGYPAVVQVGGTSGNVLCGQIESGERSMIDRLSTELNAAITTSASNAGVWSAATTVKSRFAGHNACATGSAEWIHAGNLDIGGINGFIDPKSFHPKDSGQLAYATAFSDMLIYRTS